MGFLPSSDACIDLVSPSIRLQGCATDLAAAVPALEDLDLSANLISNWGFVSDLTSALPALRALTLSRNRLALEIPSGFPTRQLTNLRTLVLNECGVTWAQVGHVNLKADGCLVWRREGVLLTEIFRVKGTRPHPATHTITQFHSTPPHPSPPTHTISLPF